MPAMPPPDKNEQSTFTWSCVVGENYTRHEQLEFICSAVQCGRQKYGLFCKTRPPVSFVISKFQKQNLVKVPFHFVSQQKTRSFEMNWYIALLANLVGSTAKTSLPWHTICILFVHLWYLSGPYIVGGQGGQLPPPGKPIFFSNIVFD